MHAGVEIKPVSGINTDKSADRQCDARRTQIVTGKLFEHDPADLLSTVTDLWENSVAEIVFYRIAELLHRKHRERNT